MPMFDAYISEGALSPSAERTLLAKIIDLSVEHKGVDSSNEKPDRSPGSFALGMTTGTGVKSALNASVFSASAAAFALAAQRDSQMKPGCAARKVPHRHGDHLNQGAPHEPNRARQHANHP